MSDNVLFKKRPSHISDFEIHWAIRDIPRSILNLPRKGILSIFVSLIGNRKSYKSSIINLQDPMGCTDKNLRTHFLYLEEMDFLIIKRPANYIKGTVNEYGLNYELILSTAKPFSCDKT